MGGAYLYGWDSDNEVWVKLICDANGKLKIDPALILENPPTEDEAKKAPTSEWAFDHDADASAHHAKYTDAESRAAINNILSAAGALGVDLDCNTYDLRYLGGFMLIYGAVTTKRIYFVKDGYGYNFLVRGWESGVGNVACGFKVYDGADYQQVCTEPVADDKITDHAADDDAHHAKYTDAEAQAACNLDGNLYWSCGGIHFVTLQPDVDDVLKSITGTVTAGADDITFIAQVNLPHGATITSARVQGNAGAGGETWYLKRTNITTGASEAMGTAAINSVDTSIDLPAVNNSVYAYYLYTTSLDSGDTIYGALITYTL